MKKMKKMLSLMLALAMLPLSAIGANAAEKESGVSYKFSKWNYDMVPNSDSWNSEVDYIGVTPDGGYNGTSGMEANIESPAQSNRFLAISNSLSSTMTGGSTYRVKFRYKGDGKFAVHFNWNNRSNGSSYKVESTDGDWKYVYKDITLPEGNSAPYIAFLCDTPQHNVIDDVSVQLMTDTDDDGTADTPNGTELVTDSSFSEYKATYSFDIEDENIYTQNTWKYENVGLNGTDGGYMKLTGKYAHSGDCAMYMKGENGDGFMTVQPRTTVPFKAEKSYKIEFYAMYTKGGTEVTAEWLRFSNMSGTAWTKSAPDSKGWVKHSRTVTIGAEDKGNIWFLLDNADEVIVDDISVYILDENGNPTGNNLIADGTFDNSYGPAEGKYKFANWTEIKNNVESADYSKYYAEPTKKEAKNGEYSMHIVYPTATKSNHFVRLSQSGDFPVGSYLVKYWAKGKGTGLQITTGLDGGLDGTRVTENGSYSDWTLVQKILEVTNNNNTFHFIGQNLDNIYIDDLEVYPVKAKDEAEAVSITNYEITGENLVDGDFEDVVSTVDTNLVAYPVIEGNKINVSWNNPKSHLIDDIDLYVNNARAEYSAIDKTYGAFNEVLVYNLTNDKEYNVKLVVTVAGEEFVYETTATPIAQSSRVSFGDWSTVKTEADGNYGNSVVTLEKDGSGNGFMRINSNIPEITPGVYGNIFSKNLTLKRNTKYVLKYKYKAENTSFLSVAQDYDIGEGSKRSKKTLISTLTTNDWKEGEFILTPDSIFIDDEFSSDTYLSSVLFLVEAGLGSVYIDNVELYEIDYLGNLGTVDLFGGSGHFDLPDYTIEAPEFAVVAEDGTTTPVVDITSGKIRVTTKIKNNAKGDSFTPAVIAALYNGTKLETLAVMEKNVAESAMTLPADEFSVDITVPALENNNYSIKVMYWNGLNSLTALQAYDELTAAE